VKKIPNRVLPLAYTPTFCVDIPGSFLGKFSEVLGVLAGRYSREVLGNIHSEVLGE
jgi:hypothetical protein